MEQFTTAHIIVVAVYSFAPKKLFKKITLTEEKNIDTYESVLLIFFLSK